MHQGFTVQPLDSGRALLAQHALPNQRAVTSFQVMVAESPVEKQPAPTTLLLFGFGPLEVAYRGKATGPNKQAFLLLQAVAQAYTGAQLKYQRNQ